MDKEIQITTPITIIPTEIYMLVLQDYYGTYHYFDKKGVYDGWSRDYPNIIKN